MGIIICMVLELSKGLFVSRVILQTRGLASFHLTQASLRKNIKKKKKTTSTFDPAFKCQRPVCRKSRNLFGSEKPSVKLRPACSVKLVFSHDVKGRKSKITAKFRVLERFRFQDTKRIMSPEKFRDFRETGPWSFSIVMLNDLQILWAWVMSINCCFSFL